MRDALKSYLALAGGLTEITRQRAVTAAKALVAQGEATAEQVSALAEDLVTQSRQNREAITALVKYEVDRTLGRVGLAAADEVNTLTQRVRALETALRDLTGSSSPAAAAPTEAAPPKAAPPKAAKAAPSKPAASKTAQSKATQSKTAQSKTPPGGRG